MVLHKFLCRVRFHVIFSVLFFLIFLYVSWDASSISEKVAVGVNLQNGFLLYYYTCMFQIAYSLVYIFATMFYYNYCLLCKNLNCCCMVHSHDIMD